VEPAAGHAHGPNVMGLDVGMPETASVTQSGLRHLAITGQRDDDVTANSHNPARNSAHKNDQPDLAIYLRILRTSGYQTLVVRGDIRRRRNFEAGSEPGAIFTRNFA
jgi:hypothetical protein